MSNVAGQKGKTHLFFFPQARTFFPHFPKAAWLPPNSYVPPGFTPQRCYVVPGSEPASLLGSSSPSGCLGMEEKG